MILVFALLAYLTQVNHNYVSPQYKVLNNHLYSIQQHGETAVIVYLRENYRSKQRAKVNEFNLKVARELGIAGKLV